jgi:hypothetical protein
MPVLTPPTSRFDGGREQPARARVNAWFSGKDVTHCAAKPIFASIPFALHDFVGYSEVAMD